MPGHRKPPRWAFTRGLTEPGWEWFWRDLAYAFVYWNGEVINLLDYERPTNPTAVSTVATEHGVGVLHTDGLDFATNYGPLQPGTGGVTMCTYYRHGQSSVNEALVAHRESNENSHMELRDNSTDGGGFLADQVSWLVKEGTNRFAVTGQILVSSPPTWYVVHGRRIGGSGNNSIWLDGVDSTSDAQSNTADLDSATGNLSLGGLPDSAAIPFTDQKLLDCGWNRDLTDGEIAMHGRDPFGPFRRFDDAALFAPLPDNISLTTLTGALNTGATGFTDVSKPGFGTPVAALIFVGGATAIDSVTDGGDISIGFSTFGASEHLSISQQDEHASAKVDCDTRKNTNTAYSLLDAAGATKVGGRVTAITNGVRLTNTSNEAGLANRFTAVLFGGADAAADLRNSAVAATQDTTVTITHAGMTDGNDKIIFFISSGMAGEDTSSTGIDNSFGWCHISGSDAGGYTFVQRCVGWASDHNNTDGSPASVTENTRCLKILTETGADDWSLEVTAYSHSSNTITVTTRDAAAGAGHEVYSLIVDLSDRAAFVGDTSAPTAGPPANFVVTGLGFKPQHVGMFLTQGQTISGIDTDLDGGSLGISNVSGVDEETCHSWYNEDAAAVTNTANVFADHAIQFHDDDTVTLLQDHDFQSFDTDGFTYDIIAENETLARNWPFWAISELAVAPAAGRIMSSMIAAGGLVAGGGLAGAGGGLAG